MIFIITTALFVGVLYLAKTDLFSSPQAGITPDYALPESRFFLPNNKNGYLVHHKYYSLSYDESAEQAEWVAYFLTKASLQAKNVFKGQKIQSGSIGKY